MSNIFVMYTPPIGNFERIQQLANEVCACCLEICRCNPEPRIQFLANSANQCCIDVCQCCNVESGQVNRSPQWLPLLVLIMHPPTKQQLLMLLNNLMGIINLMGFTLTIKKVVFKLKTSYPLKGKRFLILVS
jgi:hypothetical protein